MPSIPAALSNLLSQRHVHALYDALIDKQIDRALPAYLPEIAADIEGWGEGYRFDWPQSWYTRKKAPAATPLARHLRLPPSTPNALAKLAAQLATHTAATMPPLTHLTVKHYPHAKRFDMDLADATLLWDKLALTPLSHVELDSGGVGSPLLITLCGATLPHLRSLTIHAYSSDAELAGILSAPGLPPLAELTLTHGALGPLAAQALITHHSASLTRLTLHPERWGAYATLPDLWSAPWPALTHLSVAMAHAAPDSLRRALDAAPALDVLAWRSTAPLDLATLADAAPRAVRRLWLDHSPSDAHTAAILSSPALRGLQEALLRQSAELGPLTAAALRALPALTLLDLYAQETPCPAFWDAMRDAALPALTSLELGGPQHHRCGALEALATWRAPAMRALSLSTLHLDATHLSLIEAIPWLGQCDRLSPPRLDTPALQERWRRIIADA